ncbi:MAG: class I SAM-dependent methyltransferase [Dehalococcoidales bacterium]|nr:class I SAM-dependent methyltransferase [Dehalococcoidales bacterium]
MDKPMSESSFKMMSLAFKVRDRFQDPADILKQAGIKPGFHVLDYGCGPGAYTITAAKMVSDSGRVYAADILPLALETVKKTASRKKLTNIETILTDRDTGLDDGSIDLALLYDILHDLSQPAEILKELHRVLRPDGILSISDHHLKDRDITSSITEPGLFKLSKREEKVYNFSRVI